MEEPDFDRIFNIFKESGATCITFAEAAKKGFGDGLGNKNTVVLTFDDCYEDDPSKWTPHDYSDPPFIKTWGAERYEITCNETREYADSHQDFVALDDVREMLDVDAESFDSASELLAHLNSRLKPQE